MISDNYSSFVVGWVCRNMGLLKSCLCLYCLSNWKAMRNCWILGHVAFEKTYVFLLTCKNIVKIWWWLLSNSGHVHVCWRYRISRSRFGTPWNASQLEVIVAPRSSWLLRVLGWKQEWPTPVFILGIARTNDDFGGSLKFLTPNLDCWEISLTIQKLPLAGKWCNLLLDTPKEKPSSTDETGEHPVKDLWAYRKSF